MNSIIPFSPLTVLLNTTQDTVYCFQNVSEGSIWLKLLASFVGAFMGFGFALVIYYIKQKSDRKIAISNEAKESLEKLTYFRILVKGVLEHIEKQQASISNFIKEQETNLLDIKILRLIASNDIKRLHSLDSGGIFKAYGQHLGKDNPEWIKEYKKLYSALDFIDGAIDECKRIFLSNSKKCYTELLKIKETIQTISDRTSYYAMVKAGQLGEDRFKNEVYVFLDDILKLYRELTDANAPIMQYDERILIPLLENIVHKYKTEPFAEELIMLSKNARVRINDVEKEMSEVIAEFKRFPERTNACVKVLNETHERLSKVIGS